MSHREVPFREFLKPNRRPYTLGAVEDADLVGMRLYGEGPFFREHKAATKIRKKTHFVIHAGDIIYNKLFAWKGTFGVVPNELDGMFVSDKFPTYELDESKANRDFLRWYFKCPSLWDQAHRMSTGSAALSKLTLNPPRFLDLTAPLPSLPEQRRIAAELDRVSACIRDLFTRRDESAANTDALLLSLLDSILARTRTRYPSYPLSDLVDPDRGISYGVVQTGTPHPDGIPTLRAGDLRWFHVLLADVKRVDPAIEARYTRTRLKGTEVLLRIRGGLGEVAVCPKEMIGGNVSREIAVIPLVNDLLPEYVMYAIAAPSSQAFLTRNLRGTSYVGINLKDVRRLEIPRPPEDAQQQILEQVEDYKKTIQNIRAIQRSSRVHLEGLMPSVIYRAFYGEPACATGTPSPGPSPTPPP